MQRLYLSKQEDQKENVPGSLQNLKVGVPFHRGQYFREHAQNSNPVVRSRHTEEFDFERPVSPIGHAIVVEHTSNMLTARPRSRKLCRIREGAQSGNFCNGWSRGPPHASARQSTRQRFVGLNTSPRSASLLSAHYSNLNSSFAMKFQQNG